MEDDNTKDGPNEPSTSKKASQSNNSVDDEYNDNRDQRINRDMSESDTYSEISDVDMARTNQELRTSSILKKYVKSNAKKKNTRRLAGRIKKRGRPPAKRQPRKSLKRKSKTTGEKKERDISVSTIFTRLSSNGFQTPGCERCGHRCCLRRYNYELWKKFNRYEQDLRKYNRHISSNKDKKMDQTEKFSVLNEILKIVFPCVIMKKVLKLDLAINPDMIYEALKRLTMWKQDVPTNSILEYIAQNYPVNTKKAELIRELYDKLTIANILGIVSRTSADTWGLGHVFQKRRPNKNHVTMFWKVYADTLKPIAKKENTEIAEEPDMWEKATDKNVNSLATHEEAIL
ncbi:uncharacterized protein LOC135193794 [Vanessa tameamea]|uniref:Uncharacterized protein LOC135193794 n=1 Tax=Vanessa tameamea TaxID=334116 RepID=A0ABM4ARC9_VANTA